MPARPVRSARLAYAATGLLAALVLPCPAAPEAPAPAAGQSARKFETTVTTTYRLDYLLFLPKDYETDKTKRWPLMLFLHGAGERGTDVNRVAKHGPPMIVRDRPDFPFILVSPQCPPDQWWSAEGLVKLLDECEASLRVDHERVYLTGLSMGGFGTWQLGLRNPERFAAIAPICGGGEARQVRMAARNPAFKTLPIWAFHGAKDPVVPMAESERMVEAVKAAGNPNVRLTIYPDEQHESWIPAYANEDLYRWFLEHKRAGRKPPAPPQAKAGEPRKIGG